MNHRKDLQSQPTDKSLVSEGPYSGGSSSMLSPSITAQQPITPASGNHQVQFEFPDDLAPPASSKSNVTEENIQLVPHYGNDISLPQLEQAPPSMPSQIQQQIPAQQVQKQFKVQVHSQNEVSKNIFQRKLSDLKSSTRSLLTVSTNASTTSGTVAFRELIPLSPRVLVQNVNTSNILSSDVNPKVFVYKQKRKQYRLAATAGGMVVGGLALGPAGIAVGAGVGMATNKAFKVKEKRAQRKFEQSNFQEAASHSMVAQHQGAFC
jgi:hypothetical protein